MFYKMPYLLIGYLIFFNFQYSLSELNNVVECDEFIPVFTLGENSNPTKIQREKLCLCIWEKFPTNSWERET